MLGGSDLCFVVGCEHLYHFDVPSVCITMYKNINSSLNYKKKCTGAYMCIDIYSK